MTTWRAKVVVSAMTVMLAAEVVVAKESLIQKLLRIAGLTATPSQMRGPAETVSEGNIWIVQIDEGAPKPLTNDGGYRSPVFSAVDGMIYALKGNTIVRVPARGGVPEKVQTVPGVVKLVGFDPRTPNDIVVLFADSSPAPLGVVSLSDGKITRLPF